MGPLMRIGGDRESMRVRLIGNKTQNKRILGWEKQNS